MSHNWRQLSILWGKKHFHLKEEAADDQEAEYDYEGGQEYDKAHNVQNEEKGKGSKNMEETVDGVEEGDGAEMEAEGQKKSNPEGWNFV